MSMQRNIDIHPIIRQIIDRDCHVSWSNRRVIRHVVSKLRDGQRTFRAMPREDRRTLLSHVAFRVKKIIVRQPASQ